VSHILGFFDAKGVSSYNVVDRGDHFAAWQVPQLFSEEVRAAFRSLH